MEHLNLFLDYCHQTLNQSFIHLSGYCQLFDPLKNESNFHLQSHIPRYKSNCVNHIIFDHLNYDEMLLKVDLIDASCQQKELISKIISHYQNNENHLIVRQVSSFIFFDDHLPLLEISIKNTDNPITTRQYEWLVNLEDF